MHSNNRFKQHFVNQKHHYVNELEHFILDGDLAVYRGTQLEGTRFVISFGAESNGRVVQNIYPFKDILIIQSVI